MPLVTTACAPPPTSFITQAQAAALLGLKNPRTLASWRLRRCGPPYRVLGKRLVRYEANQLRAWAAQREA